MFNVGPAEDQTRFYGISSLIRLHSSNLINRNVEQTVGMPEYFFPNRERDVFKVFLDYVLDIDRHLIKKVLRYCTDFKAKSAKTVLGHLMCSQIYTSQT